MMDATFWIDDAFRTEAPPNLKTFMTEFCGFQTIARYICVPNLIKNTSNQLKQTLLLLRSPGPGWVMKHGRSIPHRRLHRVYAGPVYQKQPRPISVCQRRAFSTASRHCT